MFKTAIKQALKNKERTITWLANKTHVPRQSLYRYLREGKGMSVARVEEVLQFLGIELKVPKD